MNTPFLAGLLGLNGPEIWILVVLVLILFGAKKIPELARGLGKSMGEFKRARNEFESEISRAADDAERESARKQEEERKRAEATATHHS